MKNKERVIQPITDDGAVRLVAAIVKTSLRDVTRNTSKIKSKLAKDTANRNKKQAKLFFQKSRLFDLTGLNYDYLLEQQARIDRGNE